MNSTSSFDGNLFIAEIEVLLVKGIYRHFEHPSFTSVNLDWKLFWYCLPVPLFLVVGHECVVFPSNLWLTRRGQWRSNTAAPFLRWTKWVPTRLEVSSYTHPQTPKRSRPSASPAHSHSKYRMDYRKLSWDQQRGATSCSCSHTVTLRERNTIVARVIKATLHLTCTPATRLLQPSTTK